MRSGKRKPRRRRYSATSIRPTSRWLARLIYCCPIRVRTVIWRRPHGFGTPSRLLTSAARRRCWTTWMRNETTVRSEEHTSELQSLRHLVCRLLLEKIRSETRHNLLISHSLPSFVSRCCFYTTHKEIICSSGPVPYVVFYLLKKRPQREEFPIYPSAAHLDA